MICYFSTSVSVYANRGNVAIIAWNTLQAKVWDVENTKLDGEVSLGVGNAKSLLAIHFRNYTDTESNLKEVDEVTVTLTPARDVEIGERQNKSEDAYDKDFEFETSPKKSEKEEVLWRCVLWYKHSDCTL